MEIYFIETADQDGANAANWFYDSAGSNPYMNPPSGSEDCIIYSGTCTTDAVFTFSTLSIATAGILSELNSTAVYNDGTVTTVIGTVTTNNGTVTTNNGVVSQNASGGTILTNNSVVYTNDGAIYYNLYGSTVTTNNGTIYMGNIGGGVGVIATSAATDLSSHTFTNITLPSGTGGSSLTWW